MYEALENKNTAKRLWLIATGLFLASFVVRLALAWFTKAYVVYYDEPRYFDIARSLWQHGAVMIQGTPSDYQKLLYPLVLSPAFAAGSTTAAIRVITAINAALASSVVFPTLLLAKRITRSLWGIVLSMVLVLLLPDLAYSMTFMSETLTLPITLWVLLLLWQVWQTEAPKPKALYAALGGAASYLLYFGKETGLAVVIAFVLYSIVVLWLDKHCRKATLLALGVYLAAFAACFLLAKLVVFSGIGGSYNQTSFDVFDSLYRIFYLGYTIIVHSTMTLVAFFYFPVALLCFRFTHLSRAQRDLFLFTMLCLLVTLGVICFSITIRDDDYGLAMPRQHLRYMVPYFVPLIPLCIRQFEKSPKKTFRFKNPGFATSGVFVCGALFCGLVLYSVKPMLPTLVDNTMLKYIANLFSGPLFPSLQAGSGQVTLHTGIFIVKACIIVAVLGGSVALLRLPKRVFGAGLCAGVVVVCLLNNYLAVRQFREYYEIPAATAAAADDMNAALDSLDGTLLVVSRAPWDSFENRLADTYLAAAHYTVTEDTLLELQGEGEAIDLTETPLHDHLIYVWHYKSVPAFTTVEYLLMQAEGAKPSEGTATLAATYVDGQYELYRIESGSRLSLTAPPAEDA